eukprot:scaffold9972_cov118-Isochrysis_galbana.AAC.14
MASRLSARSSEHDLPETWLRRPLKWRGGAGGKFRAHSAGRPRSERIFPAKRGGPCELVRPCSFL